VRLFAALLSCYTAIPVCAPSPRSGTALFTLRFEALLPISARSGSLGGRTFSPDITR
jgi:hypothetical protein